MKLSERELDVLGLLADGKAKHEIAEALYISPSTVRNHVANILAKLHVDNRVQAGVRAVREISREEAAMIRSAVLEERRRVARDLHDGVAQELAFIASQTRWFLREPGGPRHQRAALAAELRAHRHARAHPVARR